MNRDRTPPLNERLFDVLWSVLGGLLGGAATAVFLIYRFFRIGRETD